jgi:ABC-type nickel/cobalt efflux system permease component RcnA
MFGLDDTIAGLSSGGGLLVALAVALLLGLRHATDPDHLTAVSTLVMSEGNPRGARRLGLAWGCGHALTLFAFGAPVVVLGSKLPEWLQSALELAVGVVIVALAVRLLLRWRRGYFHVHEHEHDDVTHAHPHVHESVPADPHPHAHSHSHAPRSPAAAFGIGLLHGAGGSGGVAVLLIAAMPSTGAAFAALAVLAAGTAISMAAVTALFGHALSSRPMLRGFERLAPLLGSASLAFGLCYGLAAATGV